MEGFLPLPIEVYISKLLLSEGSYIPPLISARGSRLSTIPLITTNTGVMDGARVPWLATSALPILCLDLDFAASASGSVVKISAIDNGADSGMPTSGTPYECDICVLASTLRVSVSCAVDRMLIFWLHPGIPGDSPCEFGLMDGKVSPAMYEVQDLFVCDAVSKLDNMILDILSLLGGKVHIHANSRKDTFKSNGSELVSFGLIGFEFGAVLRVVDNSTNASSYRSGESSELLLDIGFGRRFVSFVRDRLFVPI